MADVIVLGTAQDGGLPQFGARTSPDHLARHDVAARRFASSLAVVDDAGFTLLLDASPDIRHQEDLLCHLGSYMARPASAPPVDAIALTHGHMGHYLGLAHFGREAAATGQIPCYVTQAMAGFLVSNAPWRLLVEDGHLYLHAASPPASFEVAEGLEVAFIRVPHRHEYTDTVAISINGEVLYLPDIDRWEDWPEAEDVIAAHQVAFLDATFWSADEVPGRDVADIPHPLVPETLERFGHLTSGRRLVLTHLNHTNPVADPASAEAEAVRSAGFEVASEGLEITV